MLLNYFPPEIGSGPHLPFELGESLVRGGCEVTVVTGFPQYNLPRMPERYRGKLFYREEIGGMAVRRIRTLPYGKGRVSRGLFHFVAPSGLSLRALSVAKPDLVYTYTPPLPMGLAAWTIARRFGVPSVVHVQDLFPQNVIDLNMMKNRPMIRFFERMERMVYRISDSVIVISEGNIQHVVDRGGRPDRVHSVFNWVDTDLIQPGDRMNAFRASHGLGAKFVVLFAGTMGWSQGLDVVIEAARLLADVPDLLFLLVGSGVERGNLERLAEGLPNVRFLPMQSQETYPQVLTAADACLVTLRPEVATPVVPSKIPTIMAAGRPIIASIPPGDAPRLIEESEAGLSVAPGRADELAAAVSRLRSQPALARQMGEKGREFALRRFSRKSCTGQIQTILSDVIAAKRAASNV